MLWNIGLRGEAVVQINPAIKNANPVSGQPNYALDKTLACVARVVEYHDVATLDIFQFVSQLVDEDPFLVLQARLHALAFNFYRLVDKQDDEQRDANG